MDRVTSSSLLATDKVVRSSTNWCVSTGAGMTLFTLSNIL